MKFKYLEPRALAKLRNLPLIARGVVEEFIAGLHRSPFHGSSVEFSEYRKYVAGDDLKHLDWKVYGKTEKLYVKLFEDETNLQSHILLDTSDSMAYESGGLKKLTYGAHLAASLSYLMIRQQDSTGLVTFDNQIREFVPPGAGAPHLRQILSVLDEVDTRERTGLAQPLHDLAERVKRRGLMIIISDLFDDPAEVMRGLMHFRHRKHEVIIFHLLDPHETSFPFRGTTTFRDLETGQRMEVVPEAIREEYLEAIGEFIDTFRRGCAEARVDYVPVDTSVPYEMLLARFLSRRSRIG